MSFILCRLRDPFLREFVNYGTPPKAWFHYPVTCSKLKQEREHLQQHVEFIWEYPKTLCHIDYRQFLDIDIPLSLVDETREASYTFFSRGYTRLEASDNGSWLVMRNNFEIMVRYFYHIIKEKNIKAVVFEDIPHISSFVVLYYLAKALKLKTVICRQSSFTEKFFLFDSIEDYGIFATSIKKEVTNTTFGDEKNTKKEAKSIKINNNPETPFYMKKASKVSMKSLPKFKINKAELRFLKYKILMYKHWNKKAYDKLFRKRLRKELSRLSNQLSSLHNNPNLAKVAIKKYDPDENYIYFPLHLQPEMTTDVLGGEKYGDQLCAIEELVRKIDDNTIIYVKENPKQKQIPNYRENSFYQRLMMYSKVHYVSDRVDTKELIRNSKAVAVISGTAGWEALQMSKPVICFGATWYKSFHGVFNWSDDPDVSEVISFKIDPQKLQASCDWLEQYLYQGAVDSVYYNHLDNFDEAANAKRVVSSIMNYIDGKR